MANTHAMATPVQATSADDFVNSLGVNTHLGFLGKAFGYPDPNEAYNNLTVVSASINYLGVKNLRDSASASAIPRWQAVAKATGAKFDDYLAEGSVASMQSGLTLVPQLNQLGLLNFIEGGNEEDDAYAVKYGNSVAQAAAFQQKVYALGQSLKLPVINISFGAGWTWTNNYHGDYDKVGDLSAYCTYGNAHTYPLATQLPDATIKRLDSDALLAESKHPVITTEFGYTDSIVSTTAKAKYTLDAALDGTKEGNAKFYFYTLFDDISGTYGLMNVDGTPKPAGEALHNLTTLLADDGDESTPTALDYTLSGASKTLNSHLFQKKDGSFMLALWDESASNYNVTVSLPKNAHILAAYDPLTSTAPTGSKTEVANITLAIPDHPVLISIIPDTFDVPVVVVPTVPVAPVADTTSDVPTVTSTSATLQVSTGETLPIAGIQIDDPMAAKHPGDMALDVSVTSGTLSMVGAKGDGTSRLEVIGTLAQLNAALASLRYEAPAHAATAILTINPWNQVGHNSIKRVTITIAKD